jgi:hypothetical protein
MPRAQQPSVTLTERFASNALSYIISNWDSWPLRPDTDKSGTFDTLQRYLAAAADDGTHTVKYKKPANGHGRLFAERGLSLQSMVREVRNAIAHPFYLDIDFCNCHPTLLVQKCKKLGVECPLLEQYCDNRSEVLSIISPEDHSAGKTTVLALINGGGVGHASDVASCVWQQRFNNEMNSIMMALLAPGGPDHKYLKLTKKATNKMGSAMNIMLCDAENDALLALKEFLESDRLKLKVGVLMFDGCLVERSPLCNQRVLDAASDYIYEKTGYRLRLVFKDMTADMLQVPSSVYDGPPMPPPRYVKNDTSAGAMLLDDMKGSIASCAYKIYVRDGIAWTCDKNAVDAIMHRVCLMSNIKQINDGGVVSQYSAVFPKAAHIVKAAKSLIANDPTFEKRMWESNIGVVCFANGIFDFRRGSFFKYEERPDVIPRFFVQRDFPETRPPQGLIDEVRSKLLLSTLGDEGRVQTYLEIVARAMAGEAQDKQWCVMLGERNSGKGLLQGINEAAWGPYVNTVESNALLINGLGGSGDASKSLSWALDCEFVRQTYTNELKCDVDNKSIKVDGNLIKKFQSGGDVLVARKNYCDERQFHTASKLFMNLNDMPPVSPPDALDTMLLFKFPYKFVSHDAMGPAQLAFFRAADPYLKTEYCKRDDVIDAFIWMVADAYQPHRVEPSSVVKQDTIGFLEDSGDDLTLVQATFKISSSTRDFVKLADINQWAKTHNMSKMKLHDRLTRMGAFKNADCMIDGVRYGRGFLKLVMVADDDDGV